MEIDLAELKNRSYVCLDGCAMCCLCQPELSAAETDVFLERGLAPGLTKKHIQGYTTDRPTAIRLQGGNGACHFLKDRRCTVYDIRPAYCRQFPVHVHVLHRVQLNANLSCRGITSGGGTLLEHGRGVLAGMPGGLLAGAMSEAAQRLERFGERAAERSVHRSPGELRGTAGRILPQLSREGGIGRLLAFADSGSAPGGIHPDSIADMVAGCEPPLDLQEVASQGNYGQLELENPAWLPVYADRDLRWLLYRSENGKIVFYRLEADGAMVEHASFRVTDVELMRPDAGALNVIADYAALLNSRDPFLGYAYHICAEGGYAYDLMTVYLGLLATTLLDLWWRSSLIGNLLGEQELDGKLAMEGVRAFDMDCLDMPSLGLFV